MPGIGGKLTLDSVSLHELMFHWRSLAFAIGLRALSPRLSWVIARVQGGPTEDGQTQVTIIPGLFLPFCSLSRAP